MEIRRILLSLLIGTFAVWSLLQPARAEEHDLSYYLPDAAAYDPAIPTPRSVLGFEVGEWHVRHDQLADYMRRLAASSDRVLIEETGKTYELRPLLLLTISSPENLARLEEIRAQHLALSDNAAEPPDTSRLPLVVNLGYSVHGNEASGSNASLLAAYHLAAGRGEEIERLLAETVILIDPSLNPDGLARFAQWANMHRGQVLVADPDHREHQEGWPNGRTNHYWFDLNRDWLLAQHPESQARLEQFHRWRPNVLIDAHEMGSSSTFFFQPGVPKRKNPLTPERNVELTAEIARYHAEALDSLGSLYYSEETFDDFYYGKGSTYPDIHGAVGILFEQASARGHLQDTPNGPLSFPFAIRNQLWTTLSTLRAAQAKRRELLDFQHEFYRRARQSAADDDLAGYVFGDAHDPARTRHFLDVLQCHRVEVHALAKPFDAGESRRFEPDWAFVVPLRQNQYLLVRSLFERRVDFADSTFYDVSTWTLPLAFNLAFAEIRRGDFEQDLLGEPVEGPVDEAQTAHRPLPESVAYAYAFEWDGYYAPRALYRLLAAETEARVATRPFTAVTGDGNKDFAAGTIVIPMGIQSTDPAAIMELLDQAGRRDSLEIFAIASGLTPGGVDLGSPSLKPLELPKVALLVGRGIDTYAAGEIWHLLDRRHEMPLSMIEHPIAESFDLGKYTHLVLVDGQYRDLATDLGGKIWRWVRQGGVLIATQRAVPWADRWVRKDPQASPASGGATNEGPLTHPAPTLASDLEEATPETTDPRRPYGGYEADRAEQLISGAIFQVDLDLTHPLAYGYRNAALPVFRNHKVFLAAPGDPYTQVGVYSQEPLLSGYVSSENLGRLRGSPALTARREGRGAIVYLADDPSFRAFWYGTDKLMMNAIFFSPILENTADRDRREDD